MIATVDVLNDRDEPVSPLLLAPGEAARLLSISERTLARKKDEGVIPHVKIGRLVRYRPADLERYVDGLMDALSN